MTDKNAMKRVAEKLRRAGASLPAPEVTGTIEGSVVTGLCIALALVESELDALADPMREVQRLGQEIEPDDMASILACRDMLDAQPVPPRTWVGLTDEDMYVVSEEESCSFIAGAKWSEEILKGKNT
jgi:hypothetical protein